MKFNWSFITIGLVLFLSGCIGDDIVEDTIEPTVRILNPVDTIARNTTYQYDAIYFNNVGKEENLNIDWISTDNSILSLDSSGLATAHQNGMVRVIAEVEVNDTKVVMDEDMVVVGDVTVVTQTSRMGSLRTTSSYELRGDFTLEEQNGMLTLSLASNYRASSSLPGLYVYLTNNPNTVSGAFEVGKAISFSGAHSYTIPATAGVDLNDFNYVLYYCKPFNVKVGDGAFQN